MRFYLGTHMPNWLTDDRFREVPLFISRRRLYKRKTMPLSVTDWALDSGGFSELSEFGYWTITAEHYVQEVRRYSQEIGRLQWAAVMDWMCEPWILEKTGLNVHEHQIRTIESYLELSELAPEIPWCPVIQGWKLDDYMRHIRMYEDYGIDLRSFSIVGVGSVCRRQAMAEATDIMMAVQSEGINIHGFGFKKQGLQQAGSLMVSADSMAWSDAARWNPPLPGHTHKSCANCAEYALQWYQNTLGWVGTRCNRTYPMFFE